MSSYDEPMPRRPRDFDVVEAAYQAGKLDPYDEKPTIPSSRHGLEPGVSRRGRGFVEEDHRSLPRQPAIVPQGRRRTRRSNTLPVRFEDEAAGRMGEEEEIRGEQTRISEEETWEEGEMRRMEKSYKRREGFDEPPSPIIVEPQFPSRYRSGSRSRSRSHSPIRSRYDTELERNQREFERIEAESQRNRREYDQILFENHPRVGPIPPPPIVVEREIVRGGLHRSRPYPPYRDYDLNDQEVYSFTLSRHKKSLLSRDSTGGSLSDMSEKDIPVSAGSIPQPGIYYHILGSKYTGEGTLWGFQSATLKVSGETKPRSRSRSRKSPQSVFRWVQFEDSSMNLDRFENGSENIAGLTGNQKSAISRLFSRVRRKFDRQIESPDGSKFRQLAPSILHEPIPSGEKSKRGVVTWLCLPFFLLQKYAGKHTGLPSSSHPMRTLLQSHYSFAQEERDMQQAVCKLIGTPRDHCFHIAQVWCLVINDDLIVTCSRTPIPSLMGRSLSISPESPLPDHSYSGTNRPTNLLVTHQSLLWSIPLDECQTWFAFLSHFWEYWPRRLEFSTGGKMITLESWPKILGQPSKSFIRISLDFRSPVKEAKGILPSMSTATSLDEEPSDTPEVTPKFPSKHASGSTSKAASSDIPMEIPPGTSSKSKPTKQTIMSTPEIPFRNKSVKATQLSNSFHVLTWLNEVRNTTLLTANSLSPDSQSGRAINFHTFILDELNLRADLKEIDQFLKCETSFEERLIYDDCPTTTRRKVYMMLKEEGKIKAAVLGKDRTRAQNYEDKVEIFNKADALFQFFLPPEFAGHTVDKYWGAVHRLLVALSDQERDQANVIYRQSRYFRELDPYEILDWLRSTTGATQAFREIYSEADKSERNGTEIPEELQKAWLHLLMAMVFSSKDQHISFFQDQSALCSRLLHGGMRTVFEKTGQKSLLEYAVFKPWELTYLINFVLLSDIAGDIRDISETYVKYLDLLILGIENNPLDRGHQDKLTAFKQELRVISTTLQHQRAILLYAERIATAARPSEVTIPVQPDPSPGSYLMPQGDTYLEQQHSSSFPRERSYSGHHQRQSPATYNARSRYLSSQIDPTDPGGVQGLLIQDSYALIERKISLFEELKIRAEELEEENNLSIDNNKDRQDSAIYAFTVVTIIFLPLSTVATILGMNTSDIRDMEIKQWVLWATALPVILIVIILCLIWTGELGNFWEGFRNLWRGKKDRGGAIAQYSALEMPPKYMVMDPRVEVERQRRRFRDDDSDDEVYYRRAVRDSRAPRARY